MMAYVDTASFAMTRRCFQCLVCVTINRFSCSHFIIHYIYTCGGKVDLLLYKLFMLCI